MSGLHTPHDPNLLVGIETADDAGVYRLSAGGLLISVEDTQAPELLARLRQDYPDVAIIGRVRERGHQAVIVE